MRKTQSVTGQSDSHQSVTGLGVDERRAPLLFCVLQRRGLRCRKSLLFGDRCLLLLVRLSRNEDGLREADTAKAARGSGVYDIVVVLPAADGMVGQHQASRYGRSHISSNGLQWTTALDVQARLFSKAVVGSADRHPKAHLHASGIRRDGDGAKVLNLRLKARSRMLHNSAAFVGARTAGAHCNELRAQGCDLRGTLVQLVLR